MPLTQTEVGMEEEEKLEITLGDLIVALTEEIAWFVHDERETYKLVAFILTDLMHNSGPVSKSWH